MIDKMEESYTTPKNYKYVHSKTETVQSLEGSSLTLPQINVPKSTINVLETMPNYRTSKSLGRKKTSFLVSQRDAVRLELPSTIDRKKRQIRYDQ